MLRHKQRRTRHWSACPHLPATWDQVDLPFRARTQASIARVRGKVSSKTAVFSLPCLLQKVPPHPVPHHPLLRSMSPHPHPRPLLVSSLPVVHVNRSMQRSSHRNPQLVSPNRAESPARRLLRLITRSAQYPTLLSDRKPSGQLVHRKALQPLIASSFHSRLKDRVKSQREEIL